MVYFKIQKVQHYFKEEFKVLAWMIVYVICLLSTSLLSGYGNHSLHLLSLYWDFIIVAIFSLIIFFWAIFTCLSAERMEANIQKMTAGEL